MRINILKKYFNNSKNITIEKKSERGRTENDNLLSFLFVDLYKRREPFE